MLSYYSTCWDKNFTRFINFSVQYFLLYVYRLFVHFSTSGVINPSTFTLYSKMMCR